MFSGNSNNAYKAAKWIIAVITVCILIYLAISNLNIIAGAAAWIVKLFLPLILGFAMALILNVPMKSIEKYLFKDTNKPKLLKLRRPLAILCSVLIVIGIIIGISILVIPEFVNAITILSGTILTTIDKLATVETSSEFFNSGIGKYLADFDINWDSVKQPLENFAKNQGGAIINTAIGKIGSVAGGFVQTLIGLVFSIYILFDKEKLKSQATRLIRAWTPNKTQYPIIHIASVFNNTFRLFVTAQTTEAVILGSLCTLGMVILRIPYAPMIGALVGVTALIPVIGAFIGTIVGAFMIVTVDPVKALIFIIFLLILQQIEGNVIYPKVVGSSIKLPAMWVLAAVTIGGSLGGAVGMLLGVPTASALYSLIREATVKREEKLSAEVKQDDLDDDISSD